LPPGDGRRGSRLPLPNASGLPGGGSRRLMSRRCLHLTHCHTPGNASANRGWSYHQ